jgi:hypothetical protein
MKRKRCDVAGVFLPGVRRHDVTGVGRWSIRVLRGQTLRGSKPSCHERGLCIKLRRLAPSSEGRPS